jgi:hypothetical protein
MVGPCLIAVPAVFGTVSVIHFAGVIGIRGIFKKLLHQVDGIVEVIIVHVPAIDMDLSFQFGTQCFPVAFEDITEVVIFSPVFGYG